MLQLGRPVHIHVSGPEKEEQHFVSPCKERREHPGMERENEKNPFFLYGNFVVEFSPLARAMVQQ